MLYCENCHAATDEKYCPLCGGNRLRLVQDGDFCFVTEKSSKSCQGLTEAFEENGIKYTALPYGSGVETWLGLPLKNYRIFVPYPQLEKAQSIVSRIDNAETDELRDYILKNVDNLNISPRLEKKYRKKLKLPAERDFFEYCIDLIKNARTILDKGLAAAQNRQEQGSHYLYCYCGNLILCLNSETFEIYTIISD